VCLEWESCQGFRGIHYQHRVPFVWLVSAHVPVAHLVAQARQVADWKRNIDPRQ
jgi:hypothetical protein